MVAIYSSCSAHAMKLLMHSFCADVNAKGGRKLMSDMEEISQTDLLHWWHPITVLHWKLVVV